MLTKCPIAKLEAARSIRPPGFVDALLAAGTVKNGILWIDQERLNEIRKQYGVEPPLPGMLTAARNALEAVGTIAGAVLAGDKVLVSESEQERRLTICRANTCGYWRASDERCAKCTCHMRMKTMIESMKCPSGLW